MRLPDRRRTILLVAALAAGCMFGGCSNDPTEPTTAPSGDPAPLEGTITVSAAASLTDVFEQIADAFTEANPGVQVTLNFGSSGQLATQIVDGAPADVAAFADTGPMDTLRREGLLADRAEVFATNRLVVVTPPDDPAGVDGLASLEGAGTVSLCVETAPCGRFAAQLLSDAGVQVPEDHLARGDDVRATLAAVTEGDADAAIVYVSDATSAGDRVRVVQVPEAAGVVARYPIAAIADSRHLDAAEGFVAFVRSDPAQELLRRAGFGPP